VKHRAKVQFALDESRMLVLGLQVLLGFNFQSFLLPHYERLPVSARAVTLATLVLLLTALVLMLVPTAHHRIVDGGEDTRSLDVVTRWAINLALFPFAVALGGAFYVVGARLEGDVLGVVLAALTIASAMVAWYVVPLTRRRRSTVRPEDEMEKASLEDKIHHVLTETRVVLPGTQALLGFQLAGVFQSGFDDLSRSSKLVHLVGFVFLGASVIVLMLPAAYHRIAEHGENSEGLHRLTSVCVVLAMITLSGAIACDIHVVVRRATGAASAGAIGAAIWLVVSLSAWVFAMLLVRQLRKRREDRLTEPSPA
jgi:hypothetical protein